MKFEIEPLPYDLDALEPDISARTLEIHYGKHHRGYLDKLRKQIEGKPEAERSLADLIRTSEGSLFNNAAQVWNHAFYWKSMRPGGGGRPEGALAAAIDSGFGSLPDFKRQFAEAANGEFGSGWAWLVLDPGGRLRVLSSSDAENPLQRGATPLLTLDVWEHAYYLDHQNERGKYVDAFLERLVDWDFAARNLANAQAAPAAGSA
ncbi:MAG: superoxide dismutase [Myxococcales bacterium]|nr:superoxide dismutase [Myxococcales bacterium]